jgi:EAL domain-containing protein (putative c-di-GMP-specific phosphodiesterase class I)
VSVNVSARNLEAPGFAAKVIGVLEASGSAPEDLCLEITETALAGDTDAAVATLVALDRHGVAISVDDFGKGYTSLSQLRSLPVSEVKIDRSFVTGVDASDQDRSIVRSVIDLAHGLGCTVTAEGVEDAVVAAWLRDSGCDTAQGFHFARPAPWPDLLPAAVPVPTTT